ncbi:dihydrofolate reductase family protein [Kribbella sp. NPDC051952]|uniref:dihydrofolate reductase family protein n=1 Tax=Kribbella sp. NPDC051952 TaxID=3154851 RepID=UPI00341E2F98
MGTIVLTSFISLDGVVQAPGGEDFKYANWTFDFDRGDDGEKYKNDEALGADALLIGRKTYDGFAAAWPNYEGELADKYNSMPKYVVSTTLTNPTWNNTQVIPFAEVTSLKKKLPGEIQVAGSIQLAQSLLAADLVDEIHLMTFPVILGTGRHLFTETPQKTRWKLTQTHSFGEGIPVTVYKRDLP